MTLYRPTQPWHRHDVRVWQSIYEDEWHVDCYTCEESPFARNLGYRRTLRGAQDLARRHLEGRDRHARYLTAHPLEDTPVPPSLRVVNDDGA